MKRFRLINLLMFCFFGKKLLFWADINQVPFLLTKFRQMNSIKNTLFLLSFILMANSIQAQISVGPRLGINIATLGGDDADDLESIVGLQFGATAQIGITEMIAFQPELLYFQKGAKQTIEFFGQSFEAKSTLNYLEIPLLVKALFGEEDGLQFFATAGPSLGFGINGKAEADGETQDIDFDDDMIKKVDLSLAIGAGIQLPAGPGVFTGDLRYLLGLTTTDDSNADADTKNRGFGISFGYLFPIGG